MKEESQIDMMNELTKEGVESLKELLEEEIKPLIEYRVSLEKKMANKEISEMYKMEKEVR